MITDLSGAVIPDARVFIRNSQTGLSRAATTTNDGAYGAPALQPGTYELIVEAVGFQKINRAAVVEAGTTTTVNIEMVVGGSESVVSVSAAQPQIRFDSFEVSGVVTANQVEGLPLNGRNFLELIKVEPGAQPPTRGSNNRMFVPIGGAPTAGNKGARTRVTVDGGSIMEIGNGGSAMGFSQEVVQEFKVATVNFDLSTGATASGAVNVVTRSGTNDTHGAAFMFFRDHHLAAYPGLTRDSFNPDPFFQRRQFGFALGGPIRKDRVFYFATYERNEQRGVVSTELLTPDFAPLSRITASPTYGNQFSVRMDFRPDERNVAFLRHSHEDVSSYAPTGLTLNSPRSLPSAWTRQPGWADQSIVGLTSQLRPHLVNDFRFSYFFVSSAEQAPTERDCDGCLGIGAPAINVDPLFIGTSTTTNVLGRRFHWNDVLAGTSGSHQMRFGGDWELTRGGRIDTGNEPVTMTLYSPDQVRSFNASAPAGRQIPLPQSFLTLDDILQLPVHDFTVGIGDPHVPQAGFGRTRVGTVVHLFWQDVWRIRPRVVLNYGLGWTYDAELNYDLQKPVYLEPLLGERGLRPTQKNWTNFSPSLGFAWSPSAGNRTVIRGGAGIYYDPQPPFGLGDPERVSLGPRGAGRENYRNSGIISPINIGTITTGTLLNVLGRSPTLFTGSVLMQVLPAMRAALQQQHGNGDNQDFSVTNIEADKQGLFASSYLPTASATEASLGVQREVARNFVITADFVYRHFIHYGTGGASANAVDANRFNAVGGPVLRVCNPAERNDPKALCSLGPIQVFSTIGTARYYGLLLRADKRLSRHWQLLASYAWTSNTGTNFNNGFNNDAPASSYGPLDNDIRHMLNASAVLQLPRKFQLGMNVTYTSRPPFSVFLGNTQTGLDLNGDATRGDLLPGTTVNQFNRGPSKSDLIKLVAVFNQNFAGKADAFGTMAADVSGGASRLGGRKRLKNAGISTLLSVSVAKSKCFFRPSSWILRG